jgi:cyclic pyranopterin phosphate synthase
MTELTHMNSLGEAAMVNVSSKAVTYRTATASAKISLSPVALSAIKNNTLEKGEALGVARIAGILAAKKTPDLIPLCHSLPLGSVEIDLQFEGTALRITATVTTEAKTGVEMEALTACTIAALTVYDMAKSLDKSMVISDVKLLHKSGGQSGEYRAGGE